MIQRNNVNPQLPSKKLAELEAKQLSELSSVELLRLYNHYDFIEHRRQKDLLLLAEYSLDMRERARLSDHYHNKADNAGLEKLKYYKEICKRSGVIR